MNTESVLKLLFPEKLDYSIDGYFIQGHAQTAQGQVKIIGTVNSAPINQELAIKIADEILAIVQQGKQTPVVFIVDTQGQDLSRADELLCLNRTFAHLAACVDLLRREHHPNLALILGEAVSGGFLSYGLMANETFALDSSQVKVMDLNAMSRVTKIPVDRLQDLSKNSAIFAPGVENFYRMGAIKTIWRDLNASLISNVIEYQKLHLEDFLIDQRSQLAEVRQGRHLCDDIIHKILNY